MQRLIYCFKVFASLVCIFCKDAAQAQAVDSLKNHHLHEVKVRARKGISHEDRHMRQNQIQALTDKLLEYTPGVSMIRRGNFAMEPVIRGLSNGQIAVSIDGMRVFGACTDRMDPISSYIEPSNLESFAVQQNPGSSAFGSSLGGSLDFKLRRPSFSSNTSLSGIIGTGYETNGSAFQTHGGVEFSGKSLGIQANGIFRRSGNYNSGAKDEVLFSQYRKWNANFSALIKTGKRSTLKADYLQDEGYDIGYPALTMDVAYAKAKIMALSYSNGNRDSSIRRETKIYYNYINHAMDDTKRPPQTVPIHMDMPGNSRTIGAFHIWNIDAGRSNRLSLQADAYRNWLSASMTMYPENSSPMFMYTLADPVRSAVGFNVADNIAISSRFLLSPRVRLEYIGDEIGTSAGKEQLSGMFTGELKRNRLLSNLSVEAAYHANRHFSLSASVSRGGRAASLQETYAFYIYNRPDSYDYLGNPDLKNETSVNLGGGLRYHSSTFEVEGNAFGYFIKNYIAGEIVGGYSTMTIGAKGVKHYVNLEGARLQGAELALKWRIAPQLTLSSVNTYTRGVDYEKRALPTIAPFKSVNAVGYSLAKGLLRIESVTSASQKNVNFEMYGENESQGFTILNLYGGLAIKVRNDNVIRLSMEVENLLNERYAYHLDLLKVLRPGRNVLARLTMSF